MPRPFCLLFLLPRSASFACFVFLLLVPLLSGGAICSAAETANQTNISAPRGVVVFIADDQGEGDAGCYGNSAIRTPNIDALARGGLRFDNAFLTISSCSPSRSSILTGRYPHNTAAEDLHTPLPQEQKTAAYYLRQKGWYCASIGKWHLGADEKRNWDKVVACGGEAVAKQTLDALRNRPKEKPFFFWVASIDPHRPYQDNTIARPHDPKQVRVPPYLPDHPLIRQDIAYYYDEITRFDDAVGQILAALDEEGIGRDTLVFYLSDNGMPFPRAKTTLYDSGVHTPFLVRWPAVIKAGGVQTGLISSIDITPTLLKLAGVEQNTTQGRDLMPMLLDEKAPGRDRVYSEANWHDFEHFSRAVRTSRYRLVRNYYWDKPKWSSVDSVNSITWEGLLDARKKGDLTLAQAMLFQPTQPYEELYDLQADPHELKNIVGDPKQQKELWRLRAMLDNWRVETDDRMPAKRRRDGWALDGSPLPHNQPWYDNWKKRQGNKIFEVK